MAAFTVAVGTLPLVWLIVLSIFDFKSDFTLRSFFCPIADEVERNKEEIMGRGTNWECPCLGDTLSGKYLCPIYFTLITFRQRFWEECPRIFKKIPIEDKGASIKITSDAFWKSIKKGFSRYNQAMYFEIIFIQFFIVYKV